MKISELKAGMRNVSVTGKIDSVSHSREVQLKTGGTNTVADAILSDESGAVKLTLWASDINLVKPGDRVSVENAYIKTFIGENSLNIGKFGKMKSV